MIRVFYTTTGKKSDGQSILIALTRESAQEYIDEHPVNQRKRMWIKETKDEETETRKKER